MPTDQPYTAAPTRICLVAHFAFGALSGRPGHIGGVERQTSLMARWLAARGHHVTLITWDEGQPDGVVVDGVRVLKVCARDEGLPGLRFLHPRWTSLVQALSRADADVYYQNCGEYVTGQVALWCRSRGKPFTYSVASDPDCDPALPLMKTRRERTLYRYGVKHADRIVVQTHHQAQLLRDGFGVPATVIPMPCPDHDLGPLPVPVASDRRFGRVLWIGRICAVKRPDRLLETAARCPDLQFDLVGPPEEGEYAQDIVRRAALLPNVTVHGPASRETVPAFYRGASCLLCTSDIEGFPNTFLEAWSHGVPVVSTIDPDRIIAARGLGAAVTDGDFATPLRALTAHSPDWIDMGRRARVYYEANHTVDAVMRQFERLFVDAARRRVTARAA